MSKKNPFENPDLVSTNVAGASAEDAQMEVMEERSADDVVKESAKAVDRVKERSKKKADPDTEARSTTTFDGSIPTPSQEDIEEVTVMATKEPEPAPEPTTKRESDIHKKFEELRSLIKNDVALTLLDKAKEQYVAFHQKSPAQLAEAIEKSFTEIIECQLTGSRNIATSSRNK